MSHNLQPYQPPSAVMIEAAQGERERQQAAQTTQNAALLTAAIAVEPLPWLDVLAIIPLQVKLVTDIGKIYGFQLTPERARQVVVELGGALAYAWVTRQMTRGLLKVAMPLVGGLLNAPLAYASTYTLGHLAERYFRAQRGDLPSLSVEARAEWTKTLLDEGKKLASRFTLDDLRRVMETLGRSRKA